MTLETQLVVALCRTPLTAAAREAAIELIAGDLDWDRVFATASNFEVEPVFFSNLRSLGAQRIPDAVIERAAIREKESRAFALSRTLLLVDLYRKLEAANVRVIVLKGPALGVMGYGDASMRTYQDIDFLTTRDGLSTARDVLLGLGYSRDYDPAAELSLLNGDHALEFSGPGGKIELHCTLIERHLKFGLSEADLWKSSVIISCAGARIRVMDSARLLLFICAHGTKHEWSRVRWICDVAQVADRMSDDGVRDVIALAHRVHGRRILALGLQLARDVVGQNLSRFPAAAVAKGEAKSVEHVKRRLGLSDGAPVRHDTWIDRIDPGAGSLLFWAGNRERLGDRLASIARVVLVPTDKDRAYGVLGWITRPARLVARAVRRASARR